MRAGMFFGVETFTWTTSQFLDAAASLKAYGVDALIIKVAEVGSVAGNIWYGGFDQAVALLHTIQATGMGVLPYQYSYGDTYGNLDLEVSIANQFLQAGFDYCLDMESEFNGQVVWAQRVAAGLSAPVYVSTWADPVLQNWSGVLQALAPMTTFFLPQVYTAYLQGVWQQQYLQSNIPLNQCIPTITAATIPVASGRPNITMWEYSQLTGGQIQQIMSSLAPDPAANPSPAMQQAAKDFWNSTGFLFSTQKGIPPDNLGIGKSWYADYYKGIFHGPPMSYEYHTVNWQGQTIVKQNFLFGWCEWDGSPHWYHGSILNSA